MNKESRKNELLQRIRAEHTRREQCINDLREEITTEPGVIGAWSVKDIFLRME